MFELLFQKPILVAVWCRFKAVYKQNSQIVLLRYRLILCHFASNCSGELTMFVSRETEAITLGVWLAGWVSGVEDKDCVLDDDDEAGGWWWWWRCMYVWRSYLFNFNSNYY